jgi:hypothetical protein
MAPTPCKSPPCKQPTQAAEVICDEFIAAYADMYEYHTGMKIFTYGDLWRVQKLITMFETMDDSTRQLLGSMSLCVDRKHVITFIQSLRAIPSNHLFIMPNTVRSLNSLNAVIHLPLRFARFFGFLGCVYADDLKTLCANTGSGICTTHIAFLYIMHSELRAAGLLEDLARICCNYIIADYNCEPACVPTTTKR